MFYPLYPRLIKRLKRLSRGLVLDVGSGVSPFYRVVTGQGARYLSLDYPASSELTPLALPPAAGQQHIWGDARELPVRDGACDVVICTSVLEHVTDPPAVLRQIFRVLRPGGVVVGSVPFGLTLHMEPFDYYRITAHGLRHLAESLGFHVREIAPVGRGLHALGACLADLLLRNITGLKRSTMTSIGRAEMAVRLVCFALVYPVILVMNLVAPLVDYLLPMVLLPVHYIFVYEKPLSDATERVF